LDVLDLGGEMVDAGEEAAGDGLVLVEGGLQGAFGVVLATFDRGAKLLLAAL
jgi:hypothetical protein